MFRIVGELLSSAIRSMGFLGGKDMYSGSKKWAKEKKKELDKKKEREEKARKKAIKKQKKQEKASAKLKEKAMALREKEFDVQSPTLIVVEEQEGGPSVLLQAKQKAETHREKTEKVKGVVSGLMKKRK